jgi:protocatechuate 3,4-dioxygenase beta subunit
MATTQTQSVPTLEPEDPQLAQIVEEIRAFMVELIERHRITNDQWSAAIAYLSELGERKEFHALSDVMRLSVPVDRITHEDQEAFTPSNVEGPFFLPDAPTQESPAKICPDDAPGQHVVLRGKVRTADGTGLGGSVIDIWQTDAEGLYDIELHQSMSLEPGEMAYRARVRTDADGSFEIHTVKPKAYTVPTDGPLGVFLRKIGRHPWRPAHYHFRIEAEGRPPLTTMLYMADDPWLSVDVIDSIKERLLVDTSSGVVDYDFVLAD